MRLGRLHAFCVLATLAFFQGKSAFAARGATVDTDKVELREGPGTNYKVLDKLPKGSNVAAANLPIDGYYKIRTSAGVIGFVLADSLVLNSVPEEGSAPVEPPPSPTSQVAPSDVVKPTLATESGFRNKSNRRFVRIKGFGGYNFFNVGDINNLLNATVMQFGYSVGGEIDFLFTPDLAFVIRQERVFKTVFATDEKTRKSFTFDLSSYPIMAGLELTLTSDTKWSTHFTVMAGLGLLTDLTALDISDPAPNVTEMSATTFTGLAKLDLTYHFSKTFSVFIEAGYRYLQTGQITPGAVQNGSAIFQNSATQAFVPVTLNLSGPMGGAGVAVSF